MDEKNTPCECISGWADW